MPKYALTLLISPHTSGGGSQKTIVENIPEGLTEAQLRRILKQNAIAKTTVSLVYCMELAPDPVEKVKLTKEAAKKAKE